MNRILLRKEGTILYGRQAITKNPLRFLGYRVELEPFYTLRDFFQLIDQYRALADVNPFISSYMEQYHVCPKSGCRYDGIDHIELNRTVEMIGFPGRPNMEIYVSLHGIQGTRQVEIQSLGLTNLLDLELKLGKLRHVVFGDTVDTFEFETVFNLFEMIDGIAWELSFHNLPKECRIGI